MDIKDLEYIERRKSPSAGYVLWGAIGMYGGARYYLQQDHAGKQLALGVMAFLLMISAFPLVPLMLTLVMASSTASDFDGGVSFASIFPLAPIALFLFGLVTLAAFITMLVWWIKDFFKIDAWVMEYNHALIQDLFRENEQ